MSYRNWFKNHYGSRSDYNAGINCYVIDPLTIDDQARIAYWDNCAAQKIAEAEKLIENLREYRQDLAKRYAALETMSYSRKLVITRHPSWSGRGVTFDVRITRTFEDKTTIDELHERFTGKERRDALKRFEELKRTHPGIDSEMDIEKRSWEK